MQTDFSLLSLLQLASPTLPVGAYSYSEGLETLVSTGQVTDVSSLEHWLSQELNYGAVRLETAILVRAYRAAIACDSTKLVYWNHWLSAFRETEELRNQSWQMGRSLLRLLQDLQATEILLISALQEQCNHRCNFAIAFALAAAHWQIDLESTALGYLQSWLTNLISAGVKLIPLGQTAGQKLLMDLHPTLLQTTRQVLILTDDDLASCGWGMTLASMAHEVQYSRLFRS